MKVYQVRMPYYDDDHDHGYYASPLFTEPDDAQAFLDALKNVPDGDEREWWTCSGWQTLTAKKAARVVELDVCEKWDGKVLPADEYLHILYT